MFVALFFVFLGIPSLKQKEMIFQLFYKSTAIRDITNIDINNIIKTAISKNSLYNVTGCLVYFKDKFYQLLEGNKDDVELIYNAIKKDKRHYHVTLMNQEIVEFRIFSNWDMALYLPKDKDSIIVFQKKIIALNSLDYNTDTSLEFWFDIKKLISKEPSLKLNT